LFHSVYKNKGIDSRKTLAEKIFTRRSVNKQKEKKKLCASIYKNVLFHFCIVKKKTANFDL